MKFWTGIGSRETPEAFKMLMAKLAYQLHRAGYTLRSGGADGADSFFHLGVSHLSDDAAHIYIPWDGFKGMKSDDRHIKIPPQNLVKAAERIASTIHPAWYACRRGAKALHTRNVFQVLGDDLQTKSEFLVCWAPVDKNGEIQGGTATAWNLARKNNIPCFNLASVFDLYQLETWLVGQDYTKPFWK